MPFKKTNKCILSGYNSVLQDKLTRIIYENGIELSDEDWDELKHILISSSFERTGVKSVSKEGSGLRHILALYADVVLIDTDEMDEQEIKFIRDFETTINDESTAYYYMSLGGMETNYNGWNRQEF